MDANDEGSTTGPGPDAPDHAMPDRVSPDHAGPDHTAPDPAVPGGDLPDIAATDPEIPGSRRSSPDGGAPGGAVPDPGAPGRDARMPFPDLSTADDAGPDEPAPPARDDEEGLAGRDDEPRPAGLAALSLRYQVAAAFTLAVVAVAACVHLGMVFLHVAPSNTVTKQHGSAIDEWIYPEFEQNWKLFAPNPLQQNIGVQVRALVRSADGTSGETGWYDLSALDGRAIDGNPLPSHTQQNELRRAWDFYVGTHDAENRPAGLRGDLSERYLRRIAVLRLDREHAGGTGAAVERVQFRSRTTDVQPPRWSDEKVSGRPVVRELPWWPVPATDRAGGLTEASAR
ncbi:DUF5819 family protein [Streptomyces sp. NPDC006173]|uniref:DUF5819 family protein n=1 Tax=Streptomyces sp. NPDC006173 TaxID=3155349 RepID=UPI0033D878D7